MRRLLVLVVSGLATIGSALPTFADQADTDLQTALRLGQEQQQQQMMWQQQLQQQQQWQQWQQQGQDYSLGTAGVEPYCIQYGTCRSSRYGAAGYEPRPGLDTLFPGLFGQTPQADPTAYPTAEGSPETNAPAPHRRHHHKRSRTASAISRY